MDPCTEARPRVINNALLYKCIDEQLPKGEAGRLARIDGVEFEDVRQIRLEYLNILKIDHLWVLKNLTRLSLNNNYIEKIENLDSLVHLEQLDLSFNKISKIENLEHLVNLEKLSLYENFITVVENMDNLEKLRIFSIGRNKIEDRQNILYFRRFKNLTSLNMAFNPCTDDENIRYYIAVFLPKIFYYEYKKIQPEEIELGSEIYRDELYHLEQDELKMRLAREEKERQEEDARKNASSFVEYLNTRHLFDEMYENDLEGQTFLLMGEDIEEFYSEYEAAFLEACQNLFDIGQKHYIIRKTEVDAFTHSIDVAGKRSQEDSIKLKDEFLRTKSRFIEELIEEQSNMNPESDNFDPTYSQDHFVEVLDEYTVDFENVYHTTWKNLMKLELTLHEQMEDVIETFEHVLNELVNNFLEESQGVFSFIRSLEVIYTENLSNLALKVMTSMNIDENFIVPDSVRELLYDKDTLSNAVTATHDIHMQAIDNREDILTTRTKNWFVTLISDLNTNEVKRNRNIIFEISHFLDIRKEEFMNIINEFLPRAELSTSEDSL